MHGGLGVGVEAKLGIVIVFDDIAAAVLCPVQQFQPAGDRSDQTGRKMVGGRQVEHLRIPQPFGQYTFMVHGNADASDTAGGIDLPDFSVAGIFHRIGFVTAQ